MKKIVVIGSNGYIARNLIYFIKNKEDVKIYGYDIQEQSVIDIEYQQINLMNKETIELINTDVDFIYMFSGMTGVKQGFDEYEKFIDVNEKGLLALLNKMVKSKSEARIMFPSTRLVYKGKKDSPLKEDDILECNSIYGVTKLACENILKVYQKAFDIKYTVFRICVPYGDLLSGNPSYGTIGIFKKSLHENGFITIYGDGKQKRSFIHIKDLCRALLFIENNIHTINQIINVGGNDCLSILDISQILIKKGGSIKYVPFPELDEKIETGDTIFDDSKLLNLGFQYKHNLNEVLEENL